MTQQEAGEQEKFNAWWDLKGTNSVILRAQAWSAWLARAEAEQPQPSEDPDEWVILDSVNYANHIPRVGIDEFSTGNGRWQVQKAGHCNGTVAYWKAAEDLIHRCRRRDLPKVDVQKPEPQPQKTRVRLFASFGALHIRMPGEITEGIGREVKHDAEGFYVE